MWYLTLLLTVLTVNPQTTHTTKPHHGCCRPAAVNVTPLKLEQLEEESIKVSKIPVEIADQPEQCCLKCSGNFCIRVCGVFCPFERIPRRESTDINPARIDLKDRLN